MLIHCARQFVRWHKRVIQLLESTRELPGSVSTYCSDIIVLVHCSMCKPTFVAQWHITHLQRLWRNRFSTVQTWSQRRCLGHRHVSWWRHIWWLWRSSTCSLLLLIRPASLWCRHSCDYDVGTVVHWCDQLLVMESLVQWTQYFVEVTDTAWSVLTKICVQRNIHEGIAGIVSPIVTESVVQCNLFWRNQLYTVTYWNRISDRCSLLWRNYWCRETCGDAMTGTV